MSAHLDTPIRYYVHKVFIARRRSVMLLFRKEFVIWPIADVEKANNNFTFNAQMAGDFLWKELSSSLPCCPLLSQ